MFAIGVSPKFYDHFWTFADSMAKLGPWCWKIHVVFCLHWQSVDRTQTQSGQWQRLHVSIAQKHIEVTELMRLNFISFFFSAFKPLTYEDFAEFHLDIDRILEEAGINPDDYRNSSPRMNKSFSLTIAHTLAMTFVLLTQSCIFWLFNKAHIVHRVMSSCGRKIGPHPKVWWNKGLWPLQFVGQGVAPQKKVGWEKPIQFWFQVAWH